MAFCPNCFEIHGLQRPDRKQLRCCGRRYPLYVGTYRGSRYNCPRCGHKSSHADLQSGKAPRRLLALEETRDGEPRRFRKPALSDLSVLDVASQYLNEHTGEIDVPDYEFTRDRVDARPVSYGINELRELFTDRQIAVFGHAFRWVKENTDPDPRVDRALRLALSNALATNNRLCSYARDYGALGSVVQPQMLRTSCDAGRTEPVSRVGGPRDSKTQFRSRPAFFGEARPAAHLGRGGRQGTPIRRRLQH